MNPGLPRWAHLGKPYHRDNRVQFSLSPTVQFRMSLDRSVEGVLAHLRRYADPGLAARVHGRERVDDYAYDWSLNDAAQALARHDADGG